MRELDLETTPPAHAPAPMAGQAAGGRFLSIAIVGNGRAGNAFASGFSSVGHEVLGPLGREADIPGSADLVLICVPDSAVEGVASSIPEGPVVAHCCGSRGLDLLGDRPALCLHPLMTLAGRDGELHGAFAAVDATDPETDSLVHSLAHQLGMTPISIGSKDRSAYHAAASIASNFLITLEEAAERLGATAGLPREALAPLIRRTVDNWLDNGAVASLTGPVARGDIETVARQRDEIAARAPDLLPMFDSLCEATGNLAGRAVAT